MSKIFISNPRLGARYETDFATLVSIIKGTSIVSLADSDRFIEFGLTEALLVRFERDEGDRLQATLISTLNPDQVSPMAPDCSRRRGAKRGPRRAPAA